MMTAFALSAEPYIELQHVRPASAPHVSSCASLTEASYRRWLRLPLTVLGTAGCLLTVYDSLATENARVNQPREKLEAAGQHS